MGPVVGETTDAARLGPLKGVPGPSPPGQEYRQHDPQSESCP